MAGVTYSNRKAPEFMGRQRMVQVDITFDSSYPTGGEAVSAASLGISRLDRIDISPSGGYIPQWDGSRTAPKIKMYWVDTTVDGSPLLEVANTTDLATVTVTARVWGA